MKIGKRMMSLFLVTLTITGVFSCATPVLAEEYNDFLLEQEHQNNILTKTVDNDNNKADVVCEILEKRDEFSKTYKRADGSFTTIILPTPIHTYNGMEWEEIDNSLQSNGGVIVNAEGKFSIEFPENLSVNDKITIENAGENISFFINNIENSTAVISPKEEKTDMGDDLEKSFSEITYENISENTDIKYIVSSNYVKENIIVSNKQSLKDSYSFVIEKGNLVATFEQDNSLTFKNSENEKIFSIPAPIMIDADNAVSYDIDVRVTNENTNTLTLTYIPSKEWLNSKDRVYPVTIDPVIEMASEDESIIEDTMIGYDSTVPESRTMNFKNQADSIVVNSGSISNGDFLHVDILVNINTSVFAALKNPEIEIMDVNYCIRGNVECGNVLVKEINGTWDADEITYDDVYPTDNSTPQITYGTEIIDFVSGGADTEYSDVLFNITNIFKKSLGNGEKTDFAVVADGSAKGDFLLAATEKTKIFNTYLSIDYVDTSCGNDSFEYLTQEIGRAGTAYVSTLSRSLTMIRRDVSMCGLRLPAAVSFGYNPALRNFLDYYLTSIGYTLPVPYGNNWLPLNLQGIAQISDGQWQVFTSEGTIATFNQTTATIKDTDNEGNTTTITQIVFEGDSTNDNRYSLELIDTTKAPSTTNLKLISPDGNATYFNTLGLSVAICNSEDEFAEDIEAIRYTYDALNPVRITKITDGVGRQYVFTYNTTTGLLEKVDCLTSAGTQIKAGTTSNNLCVTYSYDLNNNLIGVVYPDGKSVEYTYLNGNLTKVKNIDEYGISYEYDAQGKVVKFQEYVGTTYGNLVTLEPLSNRQVKITDGYAGTQVQQFGRDGRLHYTFDDNGNYIKSDYALSREENVIENHEWQVSSENLLRNSSFEESSNIVTTRSKYWSANFERTIIEDTFDGEYAQYVSSESNVTKFIEQTINISNVSAYTFSAYVKTQTAGELTLKITAIDSNNSTQVKTTKIYSSEDWERFSVTYEPTNNFVPVKITVSIGFEQNQGAYYVDAVQFESGYGVAEYNLIKNGSFNNSAEYWSDGVTASSEINGKIVNAVKLGGGLPTFENNQLVDYVSSITQSVTVSGKKGDVYTVGGWFKGFFDDAYNTQQAESIAQVKVSYRYTENVTDENGTETTTEKTENFAVDFESRNNGWQYISDTFVLKTDTETVNVTIIAKNVINNSYATGIELTKNSSAVSLNFDDVETEEKLEEADVTEEDTENCPCDDCEEVDCLCTCVSKDLCICVQCKRRGNIEEKSEDGTIVVSKSYDGNKYMQSTVNYSNDLNNIVSEINVNNISASYMYNDGGLMISATDGSGTATSYQYNSMGYLALAQTDVTGLSDGAVKTAISYAYNGDSLESVEASDVEYTYSYDLWGQLKNVSVDEVIIISYNYGNGANRSRLNNIVFGDTVGEDFTIEYFYTNNNISSVKKYILVDGEEDAVIYNYEYDNLGNLVSVRDNATGHHILYTDNGLVISDINTNQVIYEIAKVTPETEEDAENLPLSITEEIVNNISYTHNIYESVYDGLVGKTTETEAVISGKTIGTQTVSDWFGRNESVVVMSKNPLDTNVTDFSSITANYQYKTIGDVTTNLISAINNTIAGDENNTANYSYTYNSNGRIIGVSTVSSIVNLSGITTYTYDELGQLVSETNNANTYEYAYNSNGNLTNRRMYTGGTLVDTDVFTYGADNWKDKLTSYNGSSIIYDALGNPLSYKGATFTWRGRELSSYSKGNVQVLFSYDVDGMRYQKIVKTNGAETARYDYVYSDGKLILLTHTANGVENTARFIYDSFGEVRGFILNNTQAYLYLKNGQGDITAIVDENGAVILTYSYTAWGEITYNATSMQNMLLSVTLSDINPFTYRGYCYDYDIELYYLQSRYYDPRICRFINSDSTDYLGATGTPLSYNLYAYCENDPVNYIDPCGYYKDYAFTIIPGLTQDDVVYAISKDLETSGKTMLHATYSYIPLTPKRKYDYNATISYKFSGTGIYVNFLMDKPISIPYQLRYSTYYNKKTYAEWLLYVASRHITVFDKFEDSITSALDIVGGDFEGFTYVLGQLDYVGLLESVSYALTLYDIASVLAKFLDGVFDKVDDYVMEILNRRPNLAKSSFKIAIMWSITQYTNQQFYKGVMQNGWKVVKTYYAWEL